MLNRILNSQTRTITSAAFILGIAALASRIFGLLRQGLIAGHFGRGVEADIYFAAFRIPDFVYNILIAGGVVVAFLPLFSEYYSKSKQEGWRVVNYILNVFLFLVVLLSLLLFIFTPQLIKLIAPGFSSGAQTMTILLTRLMFLSPIFFALSSIFSGILHYFHRFLAYSLAPILYNLGIIFGLIFLSPTLGVFGAGLGVVFGAFLHLLIQVLAALKCGYRYKALFGFQHPAIKKIFTLLLPRVFAVASQQINLIVIMAIASTIATGSVAVFNYARDLYYFPIGVAALPFALACFPVLSRAFAKGEREKFWQNFFSVLRQIIFLIAPLSILIFILRAQMVRLILGSLGPGRFDWTATKLTAACLGVFCFGIFAQALLPFFSRVFFSWQNTKTPTLITVGGVVLNVVLSLFFVSLLRPGANNLFYTSLARFLDLNGVANISVVGLPLAFSLAVIFQFILFLFFLWGPVARSPAKRDLRQLGPWLVKTLVCACLAGMFTYFSLFCLSNFVDNQTVIGLLLQTMGAGLCGGFVFIALAFLLKIPELRLIIKAPAKERACLK